MKTVLLALLLIPFVSFGQLSRKEKKSIDKYASDMCGCVNETMSFLNPKSVEVIVMIGQKGREQAMKEVEGMLQDMSKEEVSDFLESFNKMEDPAFIEKIEECDGSESLDYKIKSQIDNAEGDAHTYLMEFLDGEETCQLMKALYDLGAASEESSEEE